MGTPGMVEKTFKDFYDALKPRRHPRAGAASRQTRPPDPKASSGYVTESFVIRRRRWAQLAAKSELNANPKDTKDHPFGVWTLPPALRSSAEGSDKPDDPNFDHSKYVAIGESDRMTLKFVKEKK